MKATKVFSVLLAILTLFSFAACSTTGDGGDTVATTSAGADTDPGETGPELDEWGREIVKTGLPDTLSFAGETLNIYSRSDARGRWSIDFYAEEQNGTAVSDAVFRRNAEIMDKLGIEIRITERPGSYNQFDDYSNTITAAYQSGSHQIDMVGTYSLYGAQYATKGYFKNVLNISPYLDLDQIWWNQALRDDLTISNRLYFVVGDMNLTTLTRMLAVFFNQSVLASKHPGTDLYQEVIDGKWTIDYLTTFIAEDYSDLNGDQKADKNDAYGLVTVAPSEAYDSFAAALDIHIMERDSEGAWKLTTSTEHIFTALEKVANLYFGGNKSTCFMTIDETLSHFVSDKSLFLLLTLDKSGEAPLSEMTSAYGVLPMPKYDENQPAYYTIPQDAFNLVSVLEDVRKPDMVAAVLTMMSAGSYRSVVPLYYEEVLKFRYMRDSQSGMMLDYLRDGLRFDFATINTLSLGSAGHWFRSVLEGNQGNAGRIAAGLYRGKKIMFESSLNDFLAKYEELPE